MYTKDIAIEYEHLNMRLNAYKHKSFIMFYRPIMEPIGGILCWAILYFKCLEIVERILYKLFLTILIPLNDKIPYLKFINKFYDVMSLSHLY